MNERSARRGQMWSVDYTIALLLFMGVFLLGVKLIVINLHDTTFELLAQQADSASEQLASTGYPRFWTHEPVAQIVRAGLITDARLSEQKLLRFANLTYAEQKSRLGLTDDFLIELRNNSGAIVGVREHCAIGAIGEPFVSITYENEYWAPLPNAYFYNENNLLEPNIPAKYETAIYTNATGQPDNLSAMLDALDTTKVLLMENPRLGTWDELTLAQILLELERFVLHGGHLLLTGNVTRDFLGVHQNRTPEKTHTDLGIKDPFFDLAGASITNTGINYTLVNKEANNFVKLSEYPNGDAGVVRWTIGDGRVYYLPSLDVDDKPAWNAIVIDAVSSLINVSMTNCTDVVIDESGLEHLVNIERFAIYEREPTTLRLYVWRSR